MKDAKKYLSRKSDETKLEDFGNKEFSFLYQDLFNYLNIKIFKIETIEAFRDFFVTKVYLTDEITIEFFTTKYSDFDKIIENVKLVEKYYKRKNKNQKESEKNEITKQST